MYLLVRPARLRPIPQVRFLATPSFPAKPNFREALAAGPSLDEFISGEAPGRVMLGNARGYVFEWI